MKGGGIITGSVVTGAAVGDGFADPATACKGIIGCGVGTICISSFPSLSPTPRSRPPSHPPSPVLPMRWNRGDSFPAWVAWVEPAVAFPAFPPAAGRIGDSFGDGDIGDVADSPSFPSLAAVPSRPSGLLSLPSSLSFRPLLASLFRFRGDVYPPPPPPPLPLPTGARTGEVGGNRPPPRPPLPPPPPPPTHPPRSALELSGVCDGEAR